MFLYIDPGTGALIVNMIIALFVSLTYYVKNFLFWSFGLKKFNDKKEKIKITLFNEGEQYWDTFSPIINSLIKEKIFFNYYTLSYRDPALLIENKFIKSKYISRNTMGYYIFSRINSKYLIATTPNIGNINFPLRKPKNVENMIHVFHSVIGLPHYKIGSLDYYDSVIVGGDYQIKPIRDIEKIKNLKKKKIYKSGIPYFDSLLKKSIAKLDSNKKTILIASSWGSKGCFRNYGIDFIDKLSKNKYNLILRAHPQSYISEPRFIEGIKERFKKKENVIWDDSPSPSNSMNASDILISDTSSLRFDFSFIYKRPVITLKIDKDDMKDFEINHVDFFWEEEAEKMIGKVVYKENIAQIENIINDLILSFDNKNISEFRDKTFYKFGESGEAISKILK